MPWPVHPTGFFGARGDQDIYRIERSLRFNSADSAYLARTTSASFTSQRIFTFSFWCKRSSLTSAQSIFDRNQASNTNQFAVGFNSNDTFVIAARTSGTTTVSLNLVTSAVFRDTSAWYHFIVSVDNTQATLADRGKIYVNGILQSLGTQTATQNVDYHLLTGLTYDIGRTAITNSQYFNGYLSEFHFIDGQALTPSNFGETDAITGRWRAKAYTGTYGNNGFYLSFKDNTSTTTLGYDDAGSNDWTLNNFSVTAGAGNDSLVDSPTNYGTDTGVGGEVRGNYATLNPLDIGPTSSLANGNLDFSSSSNVNLSICRSTIGVFSGKWYWEILVNSSAAANMVGVANSLSTLSQYLGQNANGWGYYSDGQKFNNGSGSAYGASFTTNDVIGVALDMDAGTLVFYKNNSSQGTAFSGLSGTIFPSVSDGGTATTANLIINFGQRPFAYTAPSGFKSLCTTNLPTPSIQKPSKYMDVVAYTGTGASNSISSLGFSPDLVWIKNRGTTTSHAIYDTTRGSQNQLSSDTTGDAVTSSTGLTSFDASGFTIGTSTLVNTSGTQYVAWAWDEAPTAGMDVVAYTGNGANRTIAHNLGVAPKMIIVKARATASTDQGWPVYHASNTAAPETDYLLLNGTAATADLDTVWNDTAPTSSVFSVGTNALVNTNNDTYIAYCFSEIEGYSKFGSYTGNGSADGVFVWCGFKPRYILIKCAGTAATNWIVHDTARNEINLSDKRLLPNSSIAEGSDNEIDILSNGFKMRSADGSTNTNNSAHIFAAFAESPFKYARAR
jgi:hypothetical protein